MSSDAFRGWCNCADCDRVFMGIFEDVIAYRYRHLRFCPQCLAKREEPPEAEAQSGSNT